MQLRSTCKNKNKWADSTSEYKWLVFWQTAMCKEIVINPTKAVYNQTHLSVADIGWDCIANVKQSPVSRDNNDSVILRHFNSEQMKTDDAMY